MYKPAPSIRLRLKTVTSSTFIEKKMNNWKRERLSVMMLIRYRLSLLLHLVRPYHNIQSNIIGPPLLSPSKSLGVVPCTLSTLSPLLKTFGGITKPSKKPLSKKSEDRFNTFQKPSKKHFKPLQESNGAMLEDVQPIHLQNDDFVFRLQEITQHTQDFSWSLTSLERNSLIVELCRALQEKRLLSGFM
ncbi:unnamed protein product [Lactuca saligna]|uniref:Uncharacterized protein n=1 Tax=Lactuca saligna TaxID=75948 RepID=A0AA35VBM7_LACSI|nr:unnamed protein product [Lactuca saligna]